MADSEIAIRINDVSKDFILPHQRKNSVKSVFTGMFNLKSNMRAETQHALKNISFEIKEGEFFGIVGRNGSGKSTLLKILAGIYQPTEGTVQVRGKLVPFIELGVGFNPELTGRENVYLNGALLGFDKQHIDSMYDDIVEFAELEKFMDQKLKNYSSGMQVRLAFSMAIRADADILLIDEVLAVGDADFQRKCFEYFKSLKKNKKTVVFVSHDMEAVKEYCDRAVLINDSELSDIGSTNKIADAYTKLFLEASKQDKKLGSFNDTKRTGSGAVRIINSKMRKGFYTQDDDEVQFDLELEAYEDTFQLMTGFAIKDSQGLFINGSHTWKLQDDLELKPGKRLKVTWTCPNVYEDGLFTIDIYAFATKHEVLDRIDEALSFRVKRSHKSGCIVTMPVELQVEGGKKHLLK